MSREHILGTAAASVLSHRVIGAMPHGVVVTDPTRPDNPIVHCNPGFEKLTGYRQEEIVGRNCRFLQGPDTDPAVLDEVRRAVRERRGCEVVLVNYRKDGSPFWNALSVSPIHDETGRLTHFAGVQTDITAVKRLEERLRQAEKMEAVGRLAGGVAHDFNNLLTVINGYGELLLFGLGADDSRRGFVDQVLRAGESAARLTGQLLAFSRKQVVAPRLVDVGEAVAGAAELLRRLLGEDVALVNATTPGLGRVRIDPGQLEQILMNLAVNARDAMPQGGRLTITTRAAGPHLLLQVSDTGCGMSDEVRAHIFEPFFSTKGGRGTGLGLATVFGIVEQAGGRIQVESAPGRGTTFQVRLPLAGGSADAAAPAAAAPLPRGGETVLLTEDEEGVRSLARHVLEDCGYAVLEARDGEEAVRVAGRDGVRIDLLVTDVVLPGVSGREAARRLAAARPGLKVLYCSGHTDDALLRHGVRDREVAFLPKPFTPAALARKVREVLDG